MSSRRTRLDDLEPVKLKEAEDIPGFREVAEACGSGTTKNWPERGVPWDVVGQLLIRIWRDGLDKQRDRIAAEEARKAEERLWQRYQRELARLQAALRPQAENRGQAGAARRR